MTLLKENISKWKDQKLQLVKWKKKKKKKKIIYLLHTIMRCIKNQHSKSQRLGLGLCPG